MSQRAWEQQKRYYGTEPRKSVRSPDTQRAKTPIMHRPSTPPKPQVKEEK